MKTIIKRIVAIALAICLFIAGAEFWKYILISDSTSYTRLMMHQLYNPEDNIDVLFVGSSHVYRAFIPKITDKEFGAYTFNAGSSGQFMDGSLAVIKEADKGNDIKHVFLELYYDVVCQIRQCALRKGVETCGNCEGLEKCPTVGVILADYPEAVENLQG